MKGEKIKILLADDHLVVRMGLAAIISFEKDMRLVGEASDGEEAVRKAAELRPDVIVMDLMMPKLDGAAAASRILAANSAAKILVMTTFGESAEMKRAIDAGVAGALVKDVSKTEFLSAIRRIVAGERVIGAEIARALEMMPAVVFSDRQLEVLRLTAKGFSNREIAGLLGVGIDCVKEHLKVVFSRLNAASRTEAVAIAVSRGIVCV